MYIGIHYYMYMYIGIHYYVYMYMVKARTQKVKIASTR